MANYTLGNDHWKEWLAGFEKREDKNDYRFIITFTSSASSMGGRDVDDLESLKKFVERGNVPVIVSFLPHMKITPVPKTSQEFDL